ncbi:MAG: response regulator transcription factor [Nocardioides sp.]|nr:response regulator transcription factor [Nocardioides sp.]
MTNLLLVEDNLRVRRGLRLALEVEGFHVAEAPDAERGLACLAGCPPDVILLDVMLPDRDGFSVCRSIRAHSDVPVIMVTARADSRDVVTGLEAGADDYVTKPVVAHELCARIRALLRRVEAGAGLEPQVHVVKVGSLEVQLGEAVLLREGEPVALTRTEFRLLAALALAEGGVCSREFLLDRVWGYGHHGDKRLVDVHIGRLRHKVETDPAAPVHVVTARGMGYRLAGSSSQ